MIKNNIKKQSKITKNLIILAAALSLVTMGLFVSDYIFDKLDENKFISLESGMKSLYKKLDDDSKTGDDWVYKSVCSDNRTGWMTTGNYSCVTSISVQKKVSSAGKFNSFFTDYFNTIDKSVHLKQSSNLVKNIKSDFGKSFVVSSASKNYQELESGIECEYLIKLYQSDESVDSLYDSYGSPIIGNVGNAFISLRCLDTARNNWFPLSDTANLIIP